MYARCPAKIHRECKDEAPIEISAVLKIIEHFGEGSGYLKKQSDREECRRPACLGDVVVDEWPRSAVGSIRCGVHLNSQISSLARCRAEETTFHDSAPEICCLLCKGKRCFRDSAISISCQTTRQKNPSLRKEHFLWKRGSLNLNANH